MFDISHMPYKPPIDQRRAIALLLCAFFLLFAPISMASDVLSIKLSKKNQLRTSMFWIQHKSRLLLGASLLPASKSAHRESHRIKDAGRSAQQLSKQELSKDSPFSAVGKLFFTKRGGEISSCTAAFASNASVVLTAAHCVMTEDGDWHDDFLFVRSFGSGAQEIYAVACVAVTSMWGEFSDEKASQFDYAALKTTRIHEGARLNVSEATPPPTLNIVGYSDNHTDGMTMLKLQIDTIIDGRKIGSRHNPLGSGNSGAPWLSGSRIYSISSYYMGTEKGIIWGPPMSRDVSDLLRYTSKRCG